MKKRILSAFMTLALLLTLFPATATAASGASGDADAPDSDVSAAPLAASDSYSISSVSPSNNTTVTVSMIAPGDCALFVGLYDESGKMLDVYTENITGDSGGQGASVTFNDNVDNGRYAKACLLNPDTLAPLCQPADTNFHVEDYALIERIAINTTVNNVTTRTASVLGVAGSNNYLSGPNSANLQIAYNQAKDAVGSSSWDAQAQLRFSDGTRRTVTLDDSSNYRTSAASDNGVRENEGNIEQWNGAAWVTRGPVGSYGVVRGSYDGDGDGNWIAEPFTAGHIVRVLSNSDGYRLRAVNDSQCYTAYNFTLVDGRMSANNAAINAGGVTVGADSETRFVVEDLVMGTYKPYDGVEKAPDVRAYTNQYGVVENAIAYIYHIGGAAKLVFVTNAWYVSLPPQIVFLAAHSSAYINSDYGAYYKVSAVVNDEIKTVKVKAGGVSFTASGVTFTPGNSATQKEWNCVILNNITYDSNNFITRGAWSAMDETTGIYQGIRRVSDTEISLNTFGESVIKAVSGDVRVYFVDGSKIQEIAYSGIVDDTRDYVYCIEDENREITRLFIVDCEGDGEPIAYALNTVANVTVGYTVVTSTTAVTAGQTFTYQVRDSATAMTATSADVVSGLYYTGADNFDHPVEATEEGGVWTVSIPTDIKDADTSVYVYVTAK